MYHIMPLYAHILLPFAVGAHTLLIADPRNNKTFVAALKSTPFTIFVGIHTLFNNLLGDEAFRALDFSNLKFSTSGGMALPKATAERWQEVTGSPITEGYGLSETSPVLTANPITAIQLGTVGVKLPHTEVRIIKDDGTEAGIEEPGELQARGPQVMRGYWNRPDATAEVMTEDGYFKTGDVAVIQDDGYYRIVDRIKDMILVSGFNVYPNEIEDILSGLDGVLEVGVVGVKGDDGNETVKACVVLEEGASVSTEAIIAFAKENLAGYKCPKVVEFIDELPKSAVGKILRRELR
jgi:long-chain acyl-CoA synthetase